MPREFIANGCRRVESTMFGVNLYADPDEAYADARSFLRPRARSKVYVWKTVDGLYDWSAIPDRLVPWLKDAELVRDPDGGEGSIRA